MTTQATLVDHPKTVEDEARELTDDPALPALGMIRTRGLVETLPELRLGEEATVRICTYHPGSRATLEVRDVNRRFFIKIYAKDPAAEADLYRRLEFEGLASDSGPRVPRLLSCDLDQKVLVLSWLEGPKANRLVKDGKGRCAGELAASWLRAASKLDEGIGPPIGGVNLLHQVETSVRTLTTADAALGATARRTANILAQTQDEADVPHLVHGTLYARHIIDMGDGPGVIDWNRFGQGPLEVDAGMFLATISRTGLRKSSAAGEAGPAAEALLEGTRGLIDSNSLEWYWAASLLRLSVRHLETDPRPQPTLDARSFVAEAARHAERLVSGGTG